MKNTSWYDFKIKQETHNLILKKYQLNLKQKDDESSAV